MFINAGNPVECVSFTSREVGGTVMLSQHNNQKYSSWLVLIPQTKE